MVVTAGVHKLKAGQIVRPLPDSAASTAAGAPSSALAQTEPGPAPAKN